MMEQVLVVGPGRVGKCLALVHQRAGAKVFVLGRQQGLWMDWARAHAMQPLLEYHAAPRANLVVLLTVPDRELVAALECCQNHLHGAGNVLIHCSGVRGAELFSEAPNSSTVCAAIHPLMAFSGHPEDDAVALAAATVTLATFSTAAHIFADVIACWGARALTLAPDVERAKYHLGLSLLSNHVTALCGWAADLLQPALGEGTAAVVCEMATRAVLATVELGAGAALTGPVVRGDAETIQAHLHALSAAEAMRYRGALLSVIDLACASGRLSEKAAMPLRALVAGDSTL
jgi:predicted short-subunit dehydrogenase-like oxidoreductase (DUF2520 family)